MTMVYNGRDVMAGVAQANGWTVKVEDLVRTTGGELLEREVYRKGSAEVRVTWTPENTAVGVSVKGSRGELPKPLQGPLALVEARAFIEKRA